LIAGAKQPVQLIFHHPSFSRDDGSVVLATTAGARIWNWRPKPDGLLSTPFPMDSGEPVPVYSAAYSRSGSRIVTGDGRGSVELWRVPHEPANATPSVPTRAGTHRISNTPVVAARFDTSGRYVAAADSQGHVVVLDVRTWKRAANPIQIPAIPADVNFSQDGRLLLIAATDGTVRVWDWETGTVLATLQLHAGATRAAQYVPGHPGEILSAGDDGLAEISRCATCVPLTRLQDLAARQLARFPPS
jgi:WD40 repeat protein